MQSEKRRNEDPFMLFYAMKVKPDVCRCFEVIHPFVITLATLETTPDENSSGVVTLWYREPQKEKLLLCTLTPDHPQQSLQVFFFAKEVINLYTCGQGTVNLLGKAKATRRRSISQDHILNRSGQSASVKSGENDEDESSDSSWHPVEEEAVSEVSTDDKVSENDSDGSEDDSSDSESMSVESEDDEAGTDDQEESEEEDKPEDESKESNGITKFEAINARDVSIKKIKEVKKKSAEVESRQKETPTKKEKDRHKKSKKKKSKREPIRYMINKDK